MTARLVMNPNPVVLRSTDSIALAADYIMGKRYRRIPVVDENGCYIGVFGVHTLMRIVLPKSLVMKDGLKSASFLKTTLSDLHRRFNDVKDKSVTLCTNEEAVIISPDTPLMEALRLLDQHGGSIPVVDPDTKHVLGVISYWDVGAAILGAEV